jgi:hypothetical protein
MFRAMVGRGMCIAAVLATLFGSPVVAADLSVPPIVAPASVQSYCGPCGCLRVTYVHHRSMESTYGLNFDPRNDDQTVPHYYFGRVRAYPRYFVDGVPGPGSC